MKGEGQEFTPQELVQIARQYAESEHVTTVDFSSSPIIYVFFSRTPVLALVRWGGKIGELCLSVEIDQHGDPIRHIVAKSVCGTSLLAIPKEEMPVSSSSDLFR